MYSADQELRDEDIIVLIDLIKTGSGYDFSGYSLKSLKRRIHKVMSDHKLTITELTSMIGRNDGLMEKVVKTITVNTTELFRDPKIWKSIMNDILPLYLKKDTIRIWHPGCSTGQEVYSFMIILSELSSLHKSEIYASDINPDVLDIAREGKYKFRNNQAYLDNFDAVINSGRSPETKISYEKYFTVNEDRNLIEMSSILTQKPNYKLINLVNGDNLFEIRFDLIICRNVIIYFNNDLQNRVIDLFHRSLETDGCLILGFHESIIGQYASFFEKRNNAYFKRQVI